MADVKLLVAGGNQRGSAFYRRSLGWRTRAIVSKGNAENLALRVADLKHPTISYHVSQLQPQFDPVLVRMTPK